MTANKTVLPLLLTVVAAGSVALRAGSDKRTMAEAPAAGSSKIIAYYFHVTARCTTCKTIEAYSREAILNHFKNDVDRGRIEWQAVNVQLPANRHFVSDYQLFTKSVVLVHMADGKRQSHKILNDVWQLVREKAKFQAYIDREVRDYLARLR